MNEDLLKIEGFNRVVLEIKHKTGFFSKRGLSRLMEMPFDEVDLYVAVR